MDLLATAFAVRETIEENGRCFEVDREVGYIVEISCGRDVEQILLVGFAALLGSIWWFGYGPGARQRNQEKREHDDRIRREALEQAGVLKPRDEQRRPPVAVSSIAPGQQVLNFLSIGRHRFKSSPGDVAARLQTSVADGRFDVVALAEASSMLERFPIGEGPLMRLWTEEEAKAAQAIIDQVRLELPDRPE